MTNPINTVSKTRTRLLAAVASVAIAGAIGFGAVTTGTVPVLADAVRVDAPQVPSFADVVEKVSPAVVSVRVQEKIQPAVRRWRRSLSVPVASRFRRPSRQPPAEEVLPRVPR